MRKRSREPYLAPRRRGVPGAISPEGNRKAPPRARKPTVDTVGIVIGGLLVYAIGTDETVLWVALPPAVLLAAYAPRAISFAAGQAGFTIVLIIFNLIAPGGWMVGLVRVEDVAIGCAISLAVGVLFWPRGAEKLLRESLGAAYVRSADYVASAAQQFIGAAGTRPTESALASAKAAARGAAHRLDDADRQYLTERGAHPANVDSVGTLVAGATRLRLAAYSLSTLTPAPAMDRASTPAPPPSVPRSRRFAPGTSASPLPSSTGQRSHRHVLAMSPTAFRSCAA